MKFLQGQARVQSPATAVGLGPNKRVVRVMKQAGTNLLAENPIEMTQNEGTDNLGRWDFCTTVALAGAGFAALSQGAAQGPSATGQRLRKRKSEIQFTGVLHEAAAALMADGFARHTGKLGVCLGTTGPVTMAPG